MGGWKREERKYECEGCWTWAGRGGGEEENGEEGPVRPVRISASSLKAQPMGRQKKDFDRVTLKI